MGFLLFLRNKCNHSFTKYCTTSRAKWRSNFPKIARAICTLSWVQATKTIFCKKKFRLLSLPPLSAIKLYENKKGIFSGGRKMLFEY